MKPHMERNPTSKRHSWWWDSHISPENSKWLAENLEGTAGRMGFCVDPKSIVFEFFKVGQCQKGFTCKFSYDLNGQRKGEKIDIYTDKRDAEDAGNDVGDAGNYVDGATMESKSRVKQVAPMFREEYLNA